MQSLQNMLSIRFRNWCVPWAQALFFYSVSMKLPNWKGSSKHADPACKELMCALSVSVKSWCLHWACLSGTNVHAEIKWCLAPPKVKVTSLYFSPQSHQPKKAVWCKKSWKFKQWKISHLGTFKGIIQWFNWTHVTELGCANIIL